MASCVLAYSGGLDTSVILGWLRDEGFDVHAVYVDLGQPCEDRKAILDKARDIGATSARIVDVQEEVCRDFAFPVLQWQAKYEAGYLLGTSIARPLISKVCLEVAREDLDRDLTPEFGVAGAVDHTHPARPEFGGDFVVGEARADHGQSIADQCKTGPGSTDRQIRASG